MPDFAFYNNLESLTASPLLAHRASRIWAAAEFRTAASGPGMAFDAGPCFITIWILLTASSGGRYGLGMAEDGRISAAWSRLSCKRGME